MLSLKGGFVTVNIGYAFIGYATLDLGYLSILQ